MDRDRLQSGHFVWGEHCPLQRHQLLDILSFHYPAREGVGGGHSIYKGSSMPGSGLGALRVLAGVCFLCPGSHSASHSALEKQHKLKLGQTLLESNKQLLLRYGRK